MESKKYNRSISLHCPTCGGTNFCSPSEESVLVTCANCSLEMTRDDLIGGNQENIQAHTDEVKRDVVADFEKQLKRSLSDAFRGSKNIKIK